MGLERKMNNSVVERPSGYVKNMALRRTTKVMAQVAEMNRGGAGRMDLINPLDAKRLVEPLHLIPESAAMKILRKLEERAMDIEDLTSWVIEACEKHISANAS